MSACDELRAKVLQIASLPEGDPERAQYLDHARDCPGCTQALRQSEKLMRLIEASELPAPSAAALQRASEPILAELRGAAPGRSRARIANLPSWLVQAAAVIPGFLIPIWIGRHLELDGTAAALLVLVAASLLAATAGALRAGALVALAAAAGFAFAAGGVPGVPLAGAQIHWGGIDCSLFEMLAAVLPLAAAAVVYRRNPSPGMLAQAAAAGALAGQAGLHVACPGRHDVVHLWFFHVAGVGAAALLGFLLEGQLKSARS
jgi:hypothetical protein